MKNILTLLAIGFALPIPLSGQNFDTAWAARFQAVLDSTCAAGNYTGLSAAVYYPGEGLWTGTSGISTAGVPMDAGMRLGIASNTKLFIATTLVKLQDMGILTLEDPLYQWLPPIPNVDSTITIRQLLQHESGVYSYMQGEPGASWGDLIWNDTSHLFTPAEILTMQGTPNFPPGHGSKYCNTGFMLAALVIEAATGVPWFQKLHELNFTPLSMDSTFVGVLEYENGPLANEWMYNGMEITDGPMTSLYSVLGAAGAVFSTPGEMVHWYNMLFNGSFLSDSGLRLLTSYEPSSAMALGLFARDNTWTNTVLLEHGGDSFGYHSETIYLTDRKAILSVMTNGGSNEYLGSVFFPLLGVLVEEYPRKDDDAGITSIISPWENFCTATTVPAVRLKNFGLSILTFVNINMKLDNNPPTYFSWSGPLAPGADTLVYLPPLTAGTGNHKFKCYTSDPNFSTEGYTFNDTSWSTFCVADYASPPSSLAESFEGTVFPPPGWTTNNHLTTDFGRTGLTQYSGSFCAVKDVYEDLVAGTNYHLNLPMVNVTNVGNPELRFWYAYQYTSSGKDTLVVEVSPDCGSTWYKRFEKGGFQLTTVNFYTPDRGFYPQQASHWKEVVIPLSADTGDILIRFRFINRVGNNFYLDHVRIGNFTGIEEPIDNASFKVFPNPATSQLTVTGLPVATVIQMTDIRGRMLMSKVTSGPSTMLDLRSLPKGVYILKTSFGSRKVVKM